MTKFPPRGIDDNPELDNPIGICDCGHPEYKHRSNYDKVDWQVKEECKECMCPVYNFQHMSTQRMYFKVKGYA